MTDMHIETDTHMTDTTDAARFSRRGSRPPIDSESGIMVHCCYLNGP